MSSWIQLDSNYRSHRKTLRLVKLLGHGAQWYPVALMLYCADVCPSGEIGDDLIEEAAGWKGKAGRLLAALKDVGIIDENGVLHGWRERSGATLQRISERREADRLRKSGGAPPELPRKSSGNPKELQRNSNGTPPEIQKSSGGIPDSPLPPDGVAAAVGRIFDRYKAAFRKGAVYTLTDKRRQKIRSRLDEIGESAVMRAIDAASRDNWFRTVCTHNGVEDLLKSRDVAEKWASVGDNAGAPPPEQQGLDFMGEDIDAPEDGDGKDA